MRVRLGRPQKSWLMSPRPKDQARRTAIHIDGDDVNDGVK